MIVATIVVVVVLALLMELVAFRPLRDASPITLLVASFAVSYGLQQLAWMTVGQRTAEGRRARTPGSRSSSRSAASRSRRLDDHHGRRQRSLCWSG